MSLKRFFKKTVFLYSVGPNSPDGYRYRAFLLWRKASELERKRIEAENPEFVAAFLKLAERIGETW
jgi:hypothetical protein